MAVFFLMNMNMLDQGTVLAMASDFVDYSDLTSSRKSSNKFGFSFDFSCFTGTGTCFMFSVLPAVLFFVLFCRRNGCFCLLPHTKLQGLQQSFKICKQSFKICKNPFFLSMMLGDSDFFVSLQPKWKKSIYTLSQGRMVQGRRRHRTACCLRYSSVGSSSMQMKLHEVCRHSILRAWPLRPAD